MDAELEGNVQCTGDADRRIEERRTYLVLFIWRQVQCGSGVNLSRVAVDDPAVPREIHAARARRLRASELTPWATEITNVLPLITTDMAVIALF